MKILSMILSIFIIMALIYLSYVNFPTLSPMALLSGDSSFYISSGLIMLASGIAGFLSGILLMSCKIYDINRKYDNYKREYEKVSLKTIESSDREKVLESKIEVLEKALKDALNKK